MKPKPKATNLTELAIELEDAKLFGELHRYAHPPEDSEEGKAIKQLMGVRMHYQAPKTLKGLREWDKANQNIARKEFVKEMDKAREKYSIEYDPVLQNKVMTLMATNNNKEVEPERDQ